MIFGHLVTIEAKTRSKSEDKIINTSIIEGKCHLHVMARKGLIKGISIKCQLMGDYRGQRCGRNSHSRAYRTGTKYMWCHFYYKLRSTR